MTSDTEPVSSDSTPPVRVEDNALSHAAGTLVIGSLHIDPPLVLAPMAGHTNLPFRLLCRLGGAGLVVSEMISAKGLQYRNHKTRSLIATCAQERPVAIQVFGDAPEVLYNSVSRIEASAPDIIDLNMGCCVPKVRAAGAGIELMADPQRGIECAAALVQAAGVPVTVKLRTGLYDGDMRYLDMAAGLADVGVAAIALHARNAEQQMSGRADWTHVARLVEAVDIPVIGNGDVTAPTDALAIIEQTGCAGAMYARAALGRPWIFRQAAAAIHGRTLPTQPTPSHIMAIALCHAQMLALQYTERIAIHQMRGQMAHYTRGLPHALRLRRHMNTVHTLNDLKQLVCEYLRAS